MIRYKTKLSPLFLLLFAVAFLAAEPLTKMGSAEEVESAAGVTLTRQQQAALAAVDVRLSGVEALAAKLDDPDFQAKVAGQIDDLKKRRLALERSFDPGLYETLMHSVISRYQVVALWLQPPALGPLAVEPPLKPWSDNSWYWSYRGQPVLLVGGSDDDNLFQWAEPDLAAHLDRLAAAGGNVIRNTMSDRKDKGFEVYPFGKTHDGKYDLNTWNEEYWLRFARMLRETDRRNVFVQIEIWDRFDYTDNGGNERWQIHPYNPQNNVNYSYKQSGFAERYPDHPGANKQPFFFTTPKQQNNTVVLPFQQRFVENLLRHSLAYDHVLYCVDNETKAEEEWGRYWAHFIKDWAAARGRQVQVTEMWDDWNLRAERHKQTFDHPDLYDFVDVSQNNHNKGQQHWDNFLYVRNYLSKQPRPMNTTKTYGADGNKFGHTDQDAIERFWRHLLAGAASVRFHRPDSGLGLNDKAVAAIHAARKLESKIPLWTVEPAGELLADRDPNEAYLAADAGRAYVLYFPSGGEVRLDLSSAEGQLVAHWVSIDTGAWGPKQEIAGGSRPAIAPPEDGNWAVAILADE